MKKVLMTMVVSVAVVGCSSSPYGQGGENARQFVREQVPGLRDDIAKIEVVGVDTLLSDIGLSFARTRLADIKLAFLEDNVTYDEVGRIVDSCKAELMYLESSWRYGVTPKDEAHDSQLRKAYTVRVTMKSGDVKELRVLMDEDGVSPRMLESDMIQRITDYTLRFTR